MTFIAKPLFLLSALSLVADAYWLMGAENVLTTQRLDPIVSPGKVSNHVHSVLGGSNFGSLSTAVLRQSQCTSIPIPQDKSNYWYPHLYFQWANGSFTSLDGGAVIYYLFSNPAGNTTAFPDDFRMLSGDFTLRTYDPSSFAQQAVTFLCLDFNGVSTRHNGLPLTPCPSGIRAQINFPSCWDGKNVDSPDHKSHVSFLSTGPDSGTCSDPRFPVTLPRIFMEVYWSSGDFDNLRSQAMDTTQPYVFSYGDRTGYGYHADFVNGWEAGVLQRAVNNCHCDNYGDPTCCVQEGIFNMNKGQTCRITPTVDEQVLGTLNKLPGNNPVQDTGKHAVVYPAASTPPLMAPVYAYTGQMPTQTGNIVAQATNIPVPASPPNVGNDPSVSQSASPTSSAGNSSYRVLAPSVPTISKPGAIPPQAAAHAPNVPVSHSHSALKPSTHGQSSQEDDPCEEDEGHHSSPAEHHHSASPVAPHNHAHAASGHEATSSTDCSDSANTPHRVSGSNRGSAHPASCRKRKPRSEERRSTAHHVDRSRPNAGHRFMKFHARTF